MQGKIVLEEHFAIAETMGDSEKYAGIGAWDELKQSLLELDGRRVELLDEHGIEMAVLSLNAPAVQGIPDTARAIEVAARANDLLAEAIARHPGRLSGFAALPMQDPEAAIVELRRAVRELGLKGALVNGFSQIGDRVAYYDQPEYEPFWAAMEADGVPFYLHPRDPLPRNAAIYEGHPWLIGSAWAFGVETATHALRLMSSGLFDRHPRLKIILGHLGEGLPYLVWRVDHRFSKSPRGLPARRTMSRYLSDNFWLTTSGNFRTPALLDAMLEVGADRILFSIDYPFDDHADGARWFDTATISEADRRKIGRTNAVGLLGLPLES